MQLITYKKDRKITGHAEVDESEDIRKIKKVQGFFRGWRCRRRWKQIVAEYINSPHAENMRKRNWYVHIQNIIFFVFNQLIYI